MTLNFTKMIAAAAVIYTALPRDPHDGVIVGQFEVNHSQKIFIGIGCGGSLKVNPEPGIVPSARLWMTDHSSAATAPSARALGLHNRAQKAGNAVVQAHGRVTGQFAATLAIAQSSAMAAKTLSGKGSATLSSWPATQMSAAIVSKNSVVDTVNSITTTG